MWRDGIYGRAHNATEIHLTKLRRKMLTAKINIVLKIFKNKQCYIDAVIYAFIKCKNNARAFKSADEQVDCGARTLPLNAARFPA